ncbi:MAG: hypothetical protein GWN94_24885 [Phycisphaerae bacterium]|nr:hypothetical protein [Phycisphaerae bacterium]NIP56332.1 hypothetical protein [Phycisphaerae bacterium]NIS54290.1 hypothetical protein [Phycisphaerae bacterium]NIX29855.1 hypothetical protein [Phycisphaerae bacterium]
MPQARQIRLRIDTSTNWTTSDPTLLKGEPGIESDTGRVKIGDGSNVWSSLSYTTQLNPLFLKSYTVATVPTASSHTGAMIYVSDETGGAVPAFSDGTNWRRCTDRTIIS